jgi:hypothetical protein
MIKKMSNQKDYMKIYYKKHKKHLKNYARKYSQNHKEYYSKNAKKYRKEHKEELKEYNKIYDRQRYLKNKDKILEQRKKYYRKNRNIMIKKHKKYMYNRLKKDIKFKILSYLRRRLNLALKGNPKSSTTMNLVGCSIEQLKKYLASKFIKGMSFSNYGKWHIDHIRPCASFDLSKESEQKKCFHYTNLQPLWAKDNLKKKDKII